MPNVSTLKLIKESAARRCRNSFGNLVNLGNQASDWTAIKIKFPWNSLRTGFYSLFTLSKFTSPLIFNRL